MSDELPPLPHLGDKFTLEETQHYAREAVRAAVESKDAEIRTLTLSEQAQAKAEKGAPVAWQPTEPNVTCPVCHTALGARWLTQDDVEPPLQPTEPEWKRAALKVGEHIGMTGPEGYYEMTAAQWETWALDTWGAVEHELSVLKEQLSRVNPPVQPTKPSTSEWNDAIEAAAEMVASAREWNETKSVEVEAAIRALKREPR